MKTFLIVIGLIALCTAQNSALQNVQEIMNGFFQQGGLAAPTQAINCFDESDAATGLTFIQNVLTQVSNEEIFSIVGTFDSFKNSFPTSVVKCLKNDPEFSQIETAYKYNPATIKSAGIEYVLENMESLKTSAAAGVADINAGQYENLGVLFGQMAQQFTASQSSNDFFVSYSGDALTDIQQIFNGFFQQAGLAAPTQAINCFDESDANTAMTFAGTILTQVSHDDIFSISGTIKNFEKNFPSSVTSCLAKDPEMTQVQSAYHITSSTFSSDPIGYLLSHLGSLKSTASTGANYFNNAQYENLGELVGQFVQNYVNSEDNFFVAYSGDALADIQQIMNGFFQQGGLAAPTQAINCFDESDANTAMTFAGTILTQVSHDDIFSISGTIKNFVKNFPSSVTSCLAKDPEVTQAQAAYHITSTTFSSDPVGYLLSHLGSLKSTASTGAGYFNNGQYENIGVLAGQFVQNYVNSEDNFFVAYTGDALTDLQEIMDGFFQQGGLAAPTQAINCFDESDANTAMTFAGTILTQVSHEDIFSISGTIKNFKKNFPSSVASCLKQDPEMAQVQTAYHITKSTTSSDPVGYVLGHLGSLKSSASTGANYFNAGQYQNLGTLAGQMLQQYVADN